jgi:ATP-dependent RNA helicase DDX24/MAK5
VKGKGKAKVVEPVPEMETEDIELNVEEQSAEDDRADETDAADLPAFSKMEKEDLDEEDEEDAEVSEPFDGTSLPCTPCMPYTPDTLLPAWSEISLHSRIKRSLLELGFTKPTGIQERALPAGLAGRDVVGVAETVCTLSLRPPPH